MQGVARAHVGALLKAHDALVEQLGTDRRRTANRPLQARVGGRPVHDGRQMGGRAVERARCRPGAFILRTLDGSAAHLAASSHHTKRRCALARAGSISPLPFCRPADAP
ncbi:hypothetical protein KFE25_005559 [Diacronema lutheri]|uniref:Uncharacterized protein n=1 Tax=Diacronema lutheri TaxID=2081491 RepID=A0A8J5XMC4_DIALT|nr:hypothetical protein KFE25_005559 [Diacronema lutheri]